MRRRSSHLSSSYPPLAGETIYLSCSVSNHCALGQKLHVHVSPTNYAVDLSGSILIHVQSLSRVYSLLGRRAEVNGFVYLDRGYATEAQAAESLELVWCLEAHCPTSAQDWDPSATEASCKAEVNNLAGFLSRKRPIPQYALSEKYYRDALAELPTHCPTLSYLSELYVMTSNHSAASVAALQLCSICGAASPVTLQAKVVFDASSAIAWPVTGACNPLSVKSPSPPPPLPPRPPPLSPPVPPPSPLPPSPPLVTVTLLATGVVSDYADTSALQASTAHPSPTRCARTAHPSQISRPMKQTQN